MLRGCMSEVLTGDPESLAPSLWLADSACLAYPKGKQAKGRPTMLELVHQDIGYRHPFVDGTKGGHQVRDYGRGDDRQAGYISQIRMHIEERMSDRLCHPLVDRQVHAGALDSPVGLPGFARTLCATATHFGIPIGTPFYFEFCSRHRGLCDEAFTAAGIPPPPPYELRPPRQMRIDPPAPKTPYPYPTASPSAGTGRGAGGEATEAPRA